MSAHIIPPGSLNSLSTAILTERRNFMRFLIVLILRRRGPSLSTDPRAVPPSAYLYISYLKPFFTVHCKFEWNARFLSSLLPLSLSCVKVFLCSSACTNIPSRVELWGFFKRNLCYFAFNTHHSWALKSETPLRPLCSACLEWEHPSALRAKHPAFWQGGRMWLIWTLDK